MRLSFARLSLCALGCALGCNSMAPPMLGSLDLGGFDGPMQGVPDFAGDASLHPIGDLPMDANGPIITITAPTDKQVVAGPTVVVTATVVPQMGQKEVMTVIAFGPPGDNNQKGSTIEMSRTATPNEYSGLLDISQYGSGMLTIGVTATDLSMLSSSATVTVARDAGPLIIVYAPKSQTYRGSAAVLFSVVDAAYDIDLNATTATVQNVAVPLMKVQDSPATWDGTIDFHSMAFKMALSGVQALHITAKNANGTQSQLDVPFTVDETGPNIQILHPGPGEFVGGYITIEVQADDISGVSDNGVSVTIPDIDQNKMAFEHTVPLTREGNQMMGSDKFSGMFDTRTLDPHFVYSLMTVTATDGLGNISSVAEEVPVDNTPPAIDLDPPNTRVAKKVMAGLECSAEFDPVGDENADDGDVQNQLIWTKARVEDRGNIGLGIAVEHPSGTVASSVTLYVIQNGKGAPLIVDTNGDGNCDDINPDLQPAKMLQNPGEALVVQMSPVMPSGTPSFVPDNKPPAAPCTVNGDMSSMPPVPLCLVTDLSFAMSYTIGADPSIWTLPPVIADKVDCQGLQLDALNDLPDGPICVAVRAQDVAGNHNVSKALRLCVDRFGKGACDLNVYHPHGPNMDNSKLPDTCTGSVDNMGKVNQTRCNAGVLRNDGKLVDAYPGPSEPYLIQ
jgi:hypothetical protein